MIRPLPVNPYDGMPTYIFTHCSCISVIKTYGKPHYGPDQSFTLESALWNSGLPLWPSISYEDMIDPHSGLITFRPHFEGIFEPVVICTDDRGLSTSGSVRIYWVNPGRWLNHCPIIYIKTSKPLVIRAGEEFILSPRDLKVIDPDGDEIFVSCNIGAVGRTADGGFIWTFQSNFPGK